jgi:hypothetical protein
LISGSTALAQVRMRPAPRGANQPVPLRPPGSNTQPGLAADGLLSPSGGGGLDVRGQGGSSFGTLSGRGQPSLAGVPNGTFGASPTWNPYGPTPYANPYGNPYAYPSPFAANPYAYSPYGGMAPYGAVPPYGLNPYGGVPPYGSPFGAFNPYGAFPPYGAANPFGAFGGLGTPFGGINPPLGGINPAFGGINPLGQ